MTSKEKIYQIATKIFARNNYDAVSIDSIVEKAKIAKGTFYYHFASKEELFSNLIDQGIDELVLLIKQSIKNVNDPFKKIEAILETQLNYFLQHQDVCRILLTEVWRTETRWRKYINRINQEYITILSRVIRQGIEEKKFTKLSVKATTTAIFSLISFGSMDWVMFHSQGNKQDLLLAIKTILGQGIIAKK